MVGLIVNYRSKMYLDFGESTNTQTPTIVGVSSQKLFFEGSEMRIEELSKDYTIKRKRVSVHTLNLSSD
ncbi:hypothetical protein C5167_007890 [Papaver somniferum]|nr:hypothetical protein C5167_007890 [Papaver somniferum]